MTLFAPFWCLLPRDRFPRPRAGLQEAQRGTDVGEGVSHEVNAAALPGGAEHLGRRRLEALVGVGDDQLDAPEPAAGQGAQELGPEGFRLGRADGEPEDLSAAF